MNRPQRLFFALWPDAAAVPALAELARELASRTGGQAVPAGKIHLTVVFVGNLDDAGLERARASAAGLRAGSFEVVLDESGSFRGAKVAWAGCREPSPGLLNLQSALAGELRHAGFALEDRPFAPHVTLARKIARQAARAAIAPVAWRAQELCLVRSELGRYADVERWALGSGKSP